MMLYSYHVVYITGPLQGKTNKKGNRPGGSSGGYNGANKTATSSIRQGGTGGDRKLHGDDAGDDINGGYNEVGGYGGGKGEGTISTTCGGVGNHTRDEDSIRTGQRHRGPHNGCPRAVAARGAADPPRHSHISRCGYGGGLGSSHRQQDNNPH